MNGKALLIAAVVASAVFAEQVTPAAAQSPAKDPSEARAGTIRKYVDIIRLQEQSVVKMRVLGTDRVHQIREELLPLLAEEVLRLRAEAAALKREVEELKKMQ